MGAKRRLLMQHEAFGGASLGPRILVTRQYKGEGPKPLPHPRVCTLVCTLAYSNPVYRQKIARGVR